MNPPFDHGADIKHVEHARQFRRGRPAGHDRGERAAAAEKFEPFAMAWIDLPIGTFAGTSARAAIVVIDG